MTPNAAPVSTGLRETMTRHFLSSLSALLVLMAVSATAQPAAVTDLKKIVLGKSHGCGITQTGTLRCFGNNTDGQLGTEQRLPLSFADRALTVLSAGVTDVAISDEHTCAIVDGSLFCWGSNNHGQLGTGTAGDHIKTPTKVSAISGRVTSVAAGGRTTCAILAPRGALQCWGFNNLGQVGSGTSEEDVLKPATIIPAGVTAVAIGGQHACAVVDGGLQCWGYLLLGDDFKTQRQPVSVIPARKGVTAVAAALHTCAIVSESLHCWGRNFHNQVGVPEGSRLAPKLPTAIIKSGVTAVTVNEEDTCAAVNGALRCWGAGWGWDLGASSMGSKVPAAVSVPGVPPAAVHAIALGMRQACVLTGTTTRADQNLLQCTNRRPDPEDIDDTEPPPPPEQWRAFGTEGTGLAEPTPALPRIAPYGLWQGTIGAGRVTVLLAPARDCAARYYYQKHLFDISLIEKERRQGRVWKESLGTDREATWTFSALSPDGRSLSGEWAGRDGERRAPIRLKLLARTPATEGENGKPRYDCDRHNAAFDAPRIARALQERRIAPSDAAFQGEDGTYRYRQVSVLGDHIQSVALADAKIGLRRTMEAWEGESVAQFYDCAFGMSDRGGPPGADYYRELALQFRNARLLVLRETYSNYCGGAHPNGGISDYRVWDMAADLPVEVWRWIKGSDQPAHIVSKSLRNLLAARYGRRDETGESSCADALDTTEFFMMYPKTEGMVFSPGLPHVIQACAEDIEIPWAKMRPYLTPVGKKALQTYFGVP